MRKLDCCGHEVTAGNGRRQFLQTIALGGGAVLMSTLLPSKEAHAGKTEALLLSCMDYRLVDDTERYMAKRGMREKYDHIVLAGASLGALTDKFPAWNKAFWEHLDVAIKLHHIEKVMVMDHRDCGAYKVVLGEDFSKDAAKETEAHAKQLRALKDEVMEKYPHLKVELMLMSLKGEVTTIA